jgi:hypothetical protein
VAVDDRLQSKAQATVRKTGTGDNAEAVMKPVKELHEIAGSYEKTESDKAGMKLALELSDEALKRAAAANLDWKSVAFPLWVGLMHLLAKNGLTILQVQEVARLVYHYEGRAHPGKYPPPA